MSSDREMTLRNHPRAYHSLPCASRQRRDLTVAKAYRQQVVGFLGRSTLRSEQCTVFHGRLVGDGVVAITMTSWNALHVLPYEFSVHSQRLMRAQGSRHRKVGAPDSDAGDSW